MEPSTFYELQQGPYWGWMVAADLFLGGAGVGALLFAVTVHRVHGDRYPRIARSAAYLGPILVVGGLLLLLAKLGKPAHLFLTFVNFNPTAPLWWGGVFQTLLVIGSVWYAWSWLRRKAIHAAAEYCLAALAIIVGAYHGLLLAVITARPVWNTGPTVVSAMLAFVSTGIAAVFLVHLIRMKVAGRLVEGDHLNRFLDDMRLFRIVLLAALLLQLGTLFLWWLSLRLGALSDRQALSAANESYGSMFWWVGIGVGIVVPLLLTGFGIGARNSNRRSEVSVIVLSSILILVGGYFFRLALVLGGQAQLPVPTFS